MRTKCFMIVLTASVIAISAQAQKMDLQSAKLLFTFINERANWKLVSKATDLEFYYDVDNIQRPGPDSAIVAVKTVYTSQKAIDRLRYNRDRSYAEGSKNESLNFNYNDLSFTISTEEIYCATKNATIQDIGADFDKRGHILNIIPSAKAVVPIMPNTHIEKLYFLICEKGGNKNLK